MPTNVVYIGGSGRSGTTLLARILARVPGFTAVGEVNELWRFGLIENRPCACGKPFRQCPFWTRVGVEAFGGWGRIDPDAALASMRAFTYGDALLLSRRTRTDPRHTPYFRALERLYHGIAVAADGATIVDTSKGPPFGVAVAATPGLDVRAIHLVRDSRGVAYSWGKEVPHPYTLPRLLKMHRLDALSTARWMAHHTLMELLGRRIPMARLRYESFVADPRSELVEALASIGRQIDPGALPFVDDHTVRLGVDHLIAGNAIRTGVGEVPLVMDAEWRRGLLPLQRAQVTAMTWPLLVWYGYRP